MDMLTALMWFCAGFGSRVLYEYLRARRESRRDQTGT